jgi:hypothetical protein
MICHHTITITISWSLSEHTRTWHIALANIKPISRNLPLWDIITGDHIVSIKKGTILELLHEQNQIQKDLYTKFECINVKS